MNNATMAALALLGLLLLVPACTAASRGTEPGDAYMGGSVPRGSAQPAPDGIVVRPWRSNSWGASSTPDHG
jgi:hypothetical protein